MSGNDKQPQQQPVNMGVYKIKEIIHDTFLQNGQKDMLMAHLRHKTTQQGWLWTMRDEFIEYIRKRGPENVNVSHMISDLSPLSRELFPNDLREELVESIFEETRNYFTIDDSVAPITDPDDLHNEPEKTFLYQSKDIKPDPGLGIGVEMIESPPPSPASSTSATSSPCHSPGPISVASPTIHRQCQSPVHSPVSRQSPGTASRQSPVSAAPRPLTPQPLPPPPVLRPEPVSASKSTPPVVTTEDDEQDDDEEDEDVRNNEEDEEDELMDV